MEQGSAMTQFVAPMLIPIGTVRCTKANRKKIVINTKVTNSFNSNVTCCTNLGQESRVDTWAIDLNGENNIWLWNSVIWMDGDVWVRWHLQDKQRINYTACSGKEKTCNMFLIRLLLLQGV